MYLNAPPCAPSLMRHQTVPMTDNYSASHHMFVRRTYKLQGSLRHFLLFFFAWPVSPTALPVKFLNESNVLFQREGKTAWERYTEFQTVHSMDAHPSPHPETKSTSGNALTLRASPSSRRWPSPTIYDDIHTHATHLTPLPSSLFQWRWGELVD